MAAPGHVVEIRMEINGIAHVFVTVSDFARSREFYSKLLPYLGLVPVMDADAFYSVLFEDPDGIRLEFNFVPGKGLLAERTPA